MLRIDIRIYRKIIKGIAMNRKMINRASEIPRKIKRILLSFHFKLLNFMANKGISETSRSDITMVKEIKK